MEHQRMENVKLKQAMQLKSEQVHLMKNMMIMHMSDTCMEQQVVQHIKQRMLIQMNQQ